MTTEIDKTEELDAALKFDPIAFTEKAVGVSYKDEELGEAVTGLSLAPMMLNNERKRRLLEENNDTQFSNRVDNYLAIAEDIGFEVVLKEELPLEQDSRYENSPQEYIYVLWHSDKSILLYFDTYQTEGVNSSSMHYNIRFYKDKVDSRYSVTSSGGFYNVNTGNHYGRGESENLDDYIWSGHHDAREALRHKISQLDAYGEFQTFWDNCSICSMLGYTEWKEFDTYDFDESDRRTYERIQRLPDHIQEKINYKPRDSKDEL